MQVPAGVTMVQILWAGDARLIVFPDTAVGELIGVWEGNQAAPTNGQYKYFQLVASAPTALAIQGY